MKIRQEVWTPKTNWKTALNHGDTSKSGVVFCFGNPGKHNSQAIFNEVRHSFPGAELVFGFIEENLEEKLFLTAFHCEPEDFTIDIVDLNNLTEDSQAITDRFGEKKWKELMLCLDADKSYAQQLVTGLKQSLDQTKNIQSQTPKHRIRLGLNAMPEYNTAISLAMTGQSFKLGLKKSNQSVSKGAAATQSMWDRYAANIQSGSENYTFHLPVVLLSTSEK